MTCSDPRPLTDLEGHKRLRLFVGCCLRARILGDRFKLSEKQSFEKTTRSVSWEVNEGVEGTYMNSWLSCREVLASLRDRTESRRPATRPRNVI
jgi:hypothetical protein